jgi:type II restriction enzyme
MVINNEQKDYIKQIIIDCLRKKLKDYKSENNTMPFHIRLLGKDRMALSSFMQSLNTTFGSSIFEPVAVALAKNNFAKVQSQYTVGNEIYKNCQHKIQDIINRLSIDGNPDKIKEIEMIKSSLSGSFNELKAAKVDLFLETKEGEQFLFDLKTAKPNKGEFQKYKQTLLEWVGLTLTKDNSVKINTLLAIPYNPYSPEPYKTWTMKGMIDTKYELKVAEEFWDFLGGKGAYSELLDCFEQAGIALRPEIDNYFAKFNNSCYASVNNSCTASQ